jgi:hypothetical protein
MSGHRKLAILSDIHYASAGEQARGEDYEFRDLANPFFRFFLRAHRHYFWLRHPLRHNHLLDRFIEQTSDADLIVANGDYSCNSAFIGLSDEAAFQSARECLGKLRDKFGPRFRATIGDHELGKLSFEGKRGGMRLKSWQRATRELGLQPIWKVELGAYVLIGIASTLIALPVLQGETLPEEWPEWNRLRDQHLEEVRKAFDELPAVKRVLLFCHDPTALPFLLREDAVRTCLPQIDHTIIGHLHSHLILGKSRRLAGIPPIRFLGHSVKKFTTALREARHWQAFRIQLCPSLAGIELLKDGGYLSAEIEPQTDGPFELKRHRLPRS